MVLLDFKLVKVLRKASLRSVRDGVCQQFDTSCAQEILNIFV